MTTTVTVETHAWPARVLTCQRTAGGGDAWENPVEVEPNSKRTFDVHSTMDICVQELPLPIGIGHNGEPPLKDA